MCCLFFNKIGSNILFFPWMKQFFSIEIRDIVLLQTGRKKSELASVIAAEQHYSVAKRGFWFSMLST